MKLRLLSAVIGCAAFVPQIIGQPDQKHFAFHTPSAAISFTADSIERQDAPTKAGFASMVQLRGNVHIRTCCVQAPDWSKNKSPTPPKLVVMIQADEADFNQGTGEMDVRGAVHVNFQNYPNQSVAPVTTGTPPPR